MIMRKPKCNISFEKRNIADTDQRKQLKEIVYKVVSGVLNDSCSQIVSQKIKESGLNGFEVNVIFTDDDSIREINKEYRNIDRSTDVLSFPINDFMYGDGEIDVFNSNEETQNLMLGDIIISVPTMKKQADEYGHGKDRECAFLVCHGMLHLLGYDHMNEEDEKQMFKHADDILNSIGFLR